MRSVDRFRHSKLKYTTPNVFNFRHYVSRLYFCAFYLQQNNILITVYKDVPYYIPFDAQPIFNDSDIGTGKYYRYDLWSDPPSCAEQTLDTWSVKSYYLIQNDYNVTGIQNSYATPITVDK